MFPKLISLLDTLLDIEMVEKRCERSELVSLYCIDDFAEAIPRLVVDSTESSLPAGTLL